MRHRVCGVCRNDGYWVGWSEGHQQDRCINHIDDPTNWQPNSHEYVPLEEDGSEYCGFVIAHAPRNGVPYICGKREDDHRL